MDRVNFIGPFCVQLFNKHFVSFSLLWIGVGKFRLICSHQRCVAFCILQHRGDVDVTSLAEFYWTSSVASASPNSVTVFNYWLFSDVTKNSVSFVMLFIQ